MTHIVGGSYYMRHYDVWVGKSICDSPLLASKPGKVLMASKPGKVLTYERKFKMQMCKSSQTSCHSYPNRSNWTRKVHTNVGLNLTTFSVTSFLNS